MAYQYLAIDEPAAGVVRCAMGNPPTHTLVAPELAEIDDFVTGLARRDDVRVAIFTGAGEGVFIRHYEVGELAAASERQSAKPAPPPSDEPGLHRFHRVTLAMRAAPFVTVAAINGNAAGGGFEFALGCDLRLLANGDYAVGLPETGVGIIPGAGGTQRMARLLGVAKALELILHGRLLPPAEALRLGLVHELLPEAEFAQRALDYARNLASRSPIGLAAAKAAIYAGGDVDLASGLLIEQRQFARCMASRDAATAMRGALTGKTWRWEGR